MKIWCDECQGRREAMNTQGEMGECYSCKGKGYVDLGKMKVGATPPNETLRDKFAQAALIGMLADGRIKHDRLDETIKPVWDYADAMLRGRGE